MHQEEGFKFCLDTRSNGASLGWHTLIQQLHPMCKYVDWWECKDFRHNDLNFCKVWRPQNHKIPKVYNLRNMALGI
jgi:hypothetical protein